MAAKKKDEKVPKFDIYSLRDTSEFDFFPHLKGSTTKHGNVINSLKDGTYTPFMMPMEYEAKFNKKDKTFSASLINTDVIASPKDGVFSASFNSEQSKQLEKLLSYHRT